jgi:hypothetical protein
VRSSSERRVHGRTKVQEPANRLNVADELVGRTRADETFMWRARPGRFVVRVVDDAGRADAEELSVAMVE